MNDTLQVTIDSMQAQITSLHKELQVAYAIAPKIPDTAKIGSIQVYERMTVFDVSTIAEATVLMRALGHGIWKKHVGVRLRAETANAVQA